MNQVDESMDITKQVWWVNLLRGILVLTLGVAVLVWPGMTVTLLITFFGLYLLADGIFEIVKGFATISKKNGWYWDILRGVLEIIAGIYVLKNPGISTYALIIFIGAVFFFSGLLELISIFDKTVLGSKALRAISGFLGVVCGIAIMAYPGKGGLAFLWVLGAYAIIAGPILIALSFGQKHEEKLAVKK